MNIGIVCYPTYGGSGVIATELGKVLAAKGHQVHFITYNRPVRLDAFVQNVMFHEVRVEDYPLFEFVPYESALTSMLVDVALYQDIDIFHVHYAIPHASAAFMAREILKTLGKTVPFITTLHGTDITLVGKNKAYSPVVTYSLNQSDGVTAVSEFLKQATIDTFGVTNEIQVIPNFVDTEHFNRKDKSHFRRMIAQGEERILLHASNFRKVKRVEDVIHTFDRVRKVVPSKLLLLGDGPERSDMEALCRNLGLCDEIRFLGTIDPVEEVYSLGDLFLLPSESESFGLSALEAMACGVPVISSDGGGLPEVNLNGVTGFTCTAGDVQSMAEYAIRLLTDTELWQQFSEAARQQALRFNASLVVDLYERLYRDTLERLQAHA